MTKTEIEEYLLSLEHNLLVESERKSIEWTRDWANSIPNLPAVYLIREGIEICYVGESGSIQNLIKNLLNLKNHWDRNRYVPNQHLKTTARKNAVLNIGLTNLLDQIHHENNQTHFIFSFIPVSLGRKELEERLYVKLTPKFNLQNISDYKKAYSKDEMQSKNKNAYEKWTPECDEELEKLFCSGKPIAELCEIFGRNKGAIWSRIKKLELL